MKIPQLRVCVTEVCDKKCFYCRPEGEGSAAVLRQDKLTTEQFIYLIKQIVNEGVQEVRFTGGEPMLYKDIYKLIRAVKEMSNVSSISMVTRSLRLKQQAPLLKEAGLDTITISLDSLNKMKLKEITKVDLLDRLKEGIEACSQLGFSIKFNTVVMYGINDDEIDDFIDYVGMIKGASWKLLDYMVLPNQFEPDPENKYFLNLQGVLPKLRKKGKELPIETQPGGLGIPMPTFEMPNGALVYVKDSTVGNHYGDICKGCPRFPCQDGIMALRLTTDGKLQRCLYRQDNLLDLKPFMYHDEQELRRIIRQALQTFIGSKFMSKAWDSKNKVLA